MNKTQLIGIISLGALIFGIYIYKDASIVIENSNDKSYVEQKNNTTMGYDNGKKVFNITINKIRQNNYQHVLFAKQMSNGTIYNDSGKEIIRELKADFGRINTNIKSIIATKNIKAIIDPSTSTKSIAVQTNKFKYNHQKKLAKFHDSAKLSIDDTEINAEEFTYFNNKETLTFEKGLNLRNKGSQTRANHAILDINASTLLATKNIVTTYRKKIDKKDSDQIKALLKNPTKIYANKLMINFKDNEHSIVTYNQHVKAIQKGKELKSNELILNFKKNHFSAKKDIRLTLDNLQWLLNKKRIIKNKDIQRLLKKQTVIKSEMAEFIPSQNLFLLDKKDHHKTKEF